MIAGFEPGSDQHLVQHGMQWVLGNSVLNSRGGIEPQLAAQMGKRAVPLCPQRIPADERGQLLNSLGCPPLCMQSGRTAL